MNTSDYILFIVVVDDSTGAKITVGRKRMFELHFMNSKFLFRVFLFRPNLRDFGVSL